MAFARWRWKPLASTGSVPVKVLEEVGLEVVVVNGKYLKNLPGRKTDMKDCQ